jgi:alpha-L-glutamate ligase-like protein
MIDILKSIKNSHSLLSINERNLKYIRPYNSAHAKKIADDKLLTKKILIENGINTPALIGKISSFNKLEKFNFSKLPGSIVLKPKHGFGGEGIVVFFSKDRQGNWVKADKVRYSEKDLTNHISGILEGNFSLKNQPDTAFFEERVLIHPDFKKYSYRGMPDIRIIVFNKVPVMAMLRLPTKETDGKANLHTGGVGLGIDVASGITTTAIQHDKFIEFHPDTGERLRGIRIPFWNKILEIAVKTQLYSGLGYLGVDLVIDRIKGPMVLELNARPGLALQIANDDGLKGRLERVAGLKINSVEKGIKVAKSLFGGEVEEEIEQASGKQLVGFVEYADVYDLDGNPTKIKVRNDTGAYWSAMDYRLAEALGFKDILDDFYKFELEHPFDNLKDGKRVKILAQRHFEDHHLIRNVALVKQANGLDLRPIIELSFEMSGLRIQALFTVTHRKDMMYGVIIGRKGLKKFLIDPGKRFLG